MTQEDKELLLKDLCARLPYGVICQMEDKLIINESQYYDSTLSERHIELFRNHKDFYIKPYLRPMSSMTETEHKEYELLANRCVVSSVGFVHFEAQELIDWLNKHHFDYRGLIEKGLAIEVTKENNPYKE
jgi:hypothetical protein